MGANPPLKRAIGIIRVSEIAGREAERFHSPEIQRGIIESDCERLGMKCAVLLKELDVSGGLPIAKRPALSEAIQRIEAGEYDAIVFAYRDRVDRSIEHGGELVRRMDAADALLIAGGKQITHKTHDGWRSATIESFLNEDQRRSVQAKMRDVHRDRTEKGVACFKLPPGYRRRPDGVAELDPVRKQAIKSAFVLRSNGWSIGAIQRNLRELHGIILSPSKLARMLQNRFYLGEIHRGDFVNLHAHEPLVSRELFDAVQAAVVPRGRQGRSERLLARQGVLYCTCGGRMSVGRSDEHYIYLCRAEFCEARARISANLIERHVLEYVSDLTRGLVGRANGEARVQEAKSYLDAKQSDLERLIAMLTAADLLDEPSAAKRLAEAKQLRDIAQQTYDEALRHDEAATVAVTAEDVLRDGTLDEKQALVKAVIEKVTIAKGKGLDRVTIHPRL